MRPTPRPARALRMVMRAGALAAVLGLLASAIIVSMPSLVGAGSLRSPRGEVLVVTANLLEVQSADVADTSDMDVFVRRLLDLTPYAPDVLLLQEVEHTSAGYVARALSARTDQNFVVAVDPGENTFRVKDGRFLITETAIVVNTDTMRGVVPGGTVRTGYSEEAAAPGMVPRVKFHGHFLAEEEASSLRLSLASVHFAQRRLLASDEIDAGLRRRWSKKVADALSEAYPRSGAHITVIGGDFNGTRCLRRDGWRCEALAPFWSTLTSSPYDLTDALWRMLHTPAIDYVFTDGGIIAAGVDSTYDAKAVEDDPTRFYSDHKLRWAVVTKP